MKNIFLIIFSFLFQFSYTSNKTKDLEQIINSYWPSKTNGKLRAIVDYNYASKGLTLEDINKIKSTRENYLYIAFAKGHFCYNKNDLQFASSIFYSLYGSIFNNDNYDDQFILCHLLYDIEKILGNNINALFFLDKIQDLYNITKNEKYLYFYLLEKGVLFRNLKEFNKSLLCFEEALKIENNSKEKIPFKWLYLHLGRTYLEKGDFEKALINYRICLKDITNSNFNILYILYEFFLIDYINKDYKNAILKANQMIEIASKKNIDTYMLVPLYTKLGEIYKNSKQLTATYYFEKALEEGLKTKQEEGLFQACLYLLEKDNISKKRKIQIIKYLNHIKDNEKRKMIIKINSSDQFKKILEFDNKKNEQKRIIKFYLIVFILMVILFIVLFLAYINQKKNLFIIKTQKEELTKQNKKLLKFNAKINLEYEKIEILNNSLAHDIKSGIISIKEIAKKIKDNTLETKNLIATQKIVNETDNLRNTIDFLLENAKNKNTNNSNIKLEEIDWTTVINQAKNTLEHLILIIDPIIKINDDLPTFMGYNTQFYQLFKNLIENSLKYNNPSKSCFININITKDKKNKLIIIYEDNGIGIEKNSLAKIFEFFNQSKFEHVSMGYGIGLGICKKIVDSYNGKIIIESEVEHGTKFTIYMNEQND